MATVSYSWRTVVNSFLVNTRTELTGDQANPAITALQDGSGYFTAWDQPTNDFVDGSVIGSDGTLLNPEYQLNSTFTNDQYDPSIATLSDGRMVVTYTDTSSGDSEIRARLFSPDGAAIDLDFVAIDHVIFDILDSDVAALANGGFVITYTIPFNGAGDNEILGRIIDSDGTLHNAFIVDADFNNANSSQVVGLANGNFVMVWQKEPAAGGDSETRYQIRDAGGNLITPFGGTLIDADGSINEDIQVVALQDGGFAVAYTDNGWDIDGTEITLRIYNEDGSVRVDNTLVNEATDSDQSNPTLTLLSNGYIVVGWNNGIELNYQAFDPQGNKIADNHIAVESTVVAAEITGLAGGLLANVRSSTDADSDGNAIRSSVDALIRRTFGNDASESLKGDSLSDLMFGLGGKDTLSGGEGDDTLEGGLGNDRLNGGSGFDTAQYRQATAAVKIDLTLAGGVQNTGSAGTDTFISIEGIEGGKSNDTLKGNALANRILGGDGDDVIDGRSGNDTLVGGDGVDTASYAESKSRVTVSLDVASAQNTGGAGIDTLAEFERLIGSNFNDVLTGNAVDNLLRGGSGADKLSGGDGNDTFDGGAGNDTMDGAAGSDWATYAAAALGVKVNLNIATAQNTGGGGIDTLVSIENLIGTKANDRFTGNGSDNELRGGAGNDTLVGGDGADIIDGGAGNDIMNGGGGIDLASYASAGSAVKVNLAVTGAQNTLDGGTDTLTSFENLTGSKFNDHLTGTSGANLITGGGGQDTMNGGSGDDTLVGGAGADQLKGGGGSDTFVYLSLSDSGSALSLRDLITDFGTGDKIDLSAIDADGTPDDGDQAFVIDNTPDGGGDISITVDDANNRTIIRLFVDGDATADAVIMLSGDHSALTAGDFVL
jgi:Ca2+-binding RTX toxin-like protein